MINLALFIVAVVIFTISLPIAILYVAFNAISKVLGEVAISIDMAGNVLLSEPFNDILIKSEGYQFGKRKETISSVLGKNKRHKTLTRLGRSLADTLDWIDPNHCIKSIDNNV